ncbi:MAG: terminase TerL endonuclease subunit, partial [Candidatus Neomarinimicrobiota bacterium]
DRVKAWFWKPDDTIREHEARDRVPYTVWRDQGIIETTPGRAIQYSWVADRLGKIAVEYEIKGLAFDRYRIDDLLAALGDLGIDAYIEGKDKAMSGGIRMIPWGQGFRDMAPAVEALEVAVLETSLQHDGNPCLTWNISNAFAVSDPAGNRKIDKSKSRFRIDGAVSLAMALGLKSRDLAGEPELSAYEGMTADEIAKTMAF